MASLITIYNFSGHFINHFLGTVSITKTKDSMDSGTIVLSNNNPKITEELIRPGNFVIVEDKNLQNRWASIVVPPTSTNSTQTVLALKDTKTLLTGLPILNTQGIGLGIITLEGIAWALGTEASEGRWEHRFTFEKEENSIRFGETRLNREGENHAGKDIYTFLNELGKRKHFEWWVEPTISNRGLLSLKIRIQDIRKTSGSPIYIPKHGTVQGIGLNYSNKYATAVALMSTNQDGNPILLKYIEFEELVRDFGLFVEVIEEESPVDGGEGEGNIERGWGDRENSIGQLFQELRPRRSIQLHLNTEFERITKTVEIGSVHNVVLGDVGYRGNLRGVSLPMRTVGMSYISGEQVIGVVMEEFFPTDEFAILELGAGEGGGEGEG